MARRTSAPNSDGKAYPLFRPSARNLALALGVASGTVLLAGAAYLLGAIVDGPASGELAPGEIAARLAAFLVVSLAAALAQTPAGSFGIVLVTPLTALIGMALFSGTRER